ncbi:hypothetical protein ACFE04_013270 [Oxalis oulophora]
MGLSGPPTPVMGQQISQGSSMPPHSSYSSLISPRAQYTSNMLGNNPNMSLYQTLGNVASNSGFSTLGAFQRGNVDNNIPIDSDSISNIANGIDFHAPSSSFAMTNMANSGQMQNQQIPNTSVTPMFSDTQLHQFELQKFQNGQRLMQQFPNPHSQTQQYQVRGLANMGPVKLEQQTMNEPIGPQSFQNLGSVSMEPRLNQYGRGVGAVKLEHQNSDQAIFMQQQQQQQQRQQQQQQHFLQLSRQSSQAAVAQMNFLQQQRLLQFQQQQMLKALPQQQRAQHQQQFSEQNMLPRAAVRPLYEPGSCARRLNQYIFQQKHKPEDNNIEFWRKFVGEFFAPNAKKRLCVSLYGNSRQTNGVFPQDSWHCQICNHKPGRGFETTAEVLPRLFKLKYDSGTLEELLYVDMPREYHNESGQVVLDYAKVTQESVFEHLRVARDGQLRIVFSPDLKICSWEFCARHHEELIPRKLIVQQVSQLGAAMQQYQASVQSASSSTSPSPDLLNNCNMFVKSARQLAKALEVPLVNDLGYTKRYVRCLQISEVVNSMKDLIDYGRETGSGPIESLAKYPRMTHSQTAPRSSAQQPEDSQQTTKQNMNDEHCSAQTSVMLPSTSNIDESHCKSTTTTATDTVGLNRQDSTNSRAESQMNNNPGSPYTGGTPAQIPSAGSSSTLPGSSAQANPPSPFSSPTPSSPNNPPQISHNVVGSSNPATYINATNFPAQSNEGDPRECQSSVDKILEEIMSSSQFRGNNEKVFNGPPTQVNGNLLGAGNDTVGNSSIGFGGLGNMGSANGPSVSVNGSGMRAAVGPTSMSGRVGVPVMPQGTYLSQHQQELASRFLNGLGSGSGFNNRF